MIDGVKYSKKKEKNYLERGNNMNKSLEDK